MNTYDLLMAWLAARPLRTRVRVYNLVLAIAGISFLLVVGLPLIEIDHLWRIDLDDLTKVTIATSAIAAVLAKANARAARGDQ
ncbi:hypothetical protein GCM10009795_039870 [Nocardioides hankookensis]|uniref:Holin n=1 Tax=Nocardioides hankookensis TaxID=443157 RepID=A0ABW1LRG1_9ACTN